MAEMDWTRPVAAREPTTLESVLGRIPRWVDWEAIITLVLVLGAVTAVTVPLEEDGWSRNMPPLTTVGVMSTLVGMLLARSKLSALVAWPMTVLAGAGVVFWQTLVMVGPGTPRERVDEIYTRFSAWFDVAFSNNVTHDSLPFNVLIISITWLGVAMFSWSVYRWHNAWLGVIPGGVALFLDLILVGDNLTGSIVLYMLFGFLLVMQTNLLALLRKWRQEGVQYPPLINLTFINFTAFALVGLISFAWILPTGPFSTPAPVQRGIDETLKFGTDFVRLAGPLRSNKVIPIHSYSGVLPFQGSISLSDRDLLAVTPTDPRVRGPFLLRGSVYDQYGIGGWTTGERREVALPPGTGSVGQTRTEIAKKELAGIVVPLHIELTAKSVVGTIVFTPGETLTVSRPLTAEVPAGTVTNLSLVLEDGGRYLSDEEVLALVPEGFVGLSVERNPTYGTVQTVEAVRLDEYGTLDEVVSLDPGERIRRHRSYDITAFVPTIDEAALREAGTDYPDWVTAQYLQLPEDPAVPDRVNDLAIELQADATNAYDTAKAIEAYLRAYQVDYDIPDTPPDRDPVDYFLFDQRKGYFDYHASAMVVMLRQLGVPTRLAVGFAVGTDDVDDEGAYVVRDEDSFAWPEVYFPGSGWVPFNPTPSRDEEIVPVRSENPLENDAILKDGIRDIFDSLPASVDGSFIPPEGVTFGDEPQPSSAFFDDSEGSTSPWLMSAVSVFIALIIGALFLGWQRSVAGLPYPQQLWEKTVRLASWGGLPPEPGQTPHDYAARLSKRFRDVSEWPTLADAYTRSRFGHKETGAEEREQLQDTWQDTRSALIGGILARPFRRWRRG